MKRRGFKMRKFKGTPGKWSVGLGVVVSDTPHPSMVDSKTGHCDIEYYGGYLVAESIFTKTDAEAIADMPKMLDMIVEMRSEMQTVINHLGRYVNTENYKRITHLLNRSATLIDKHTEEENTNQ